jgi:toxin ParE1/3/4
VKLRYTPRATRDIAEIADYIRMENPAASERVRASIIESLQLVTEFPLIGRAQSVPGVRKLITRRYHYVVYYNIASDSDELTVLTVRNSSRDREYVDK